VSAARAAAAGCLLAAACAAPAPGTAAGAPALVLRLQLEPDGGGGEVELAGDGSGCVRSSRYDGAPSQAALGRDAGRARIVASAPERLRGVPRWLHASGTFAGARVGIDVVGRPVHDGSRALLPPVAALLRDLAGTDAALASRIEPVLAAPASQGPQFAFSPGDDPARLLQVLTRESGDVPLRHLCARIAIAERARGLCPDLRAAFLRARERDGEGDYFVASALLRLGDPVGLPRVASVLLASRPQWEEEAAADLAACLPEDAFTRPVTPDEAAAARDRLLVWFTEHGPRLRFDAGSGRYVAGESSGPGR
jgi:hypothetical protein